MGTTQLNPVKSDRQLTVARYSLYMIGTAMFYLIGGLLYNYNVSLDLLVTKESILV